MNDEGTVAPHAGAARHCSPSFRALLTYVFAAVTSISSAGYGRIISPNRSGSDSLGASPHGREPPTKVDHSRRARTVSLSRQAVRPTMGSLPSKQFTPPRSGWA